MALARPLENQPSEHIRYNIFSKRYYAVDSSNDMLEPATEIAILLQPVLGQLVVGEVQ